MAGSEQQLHCVSGGVWVECRFCAMDHPRILREADKDRRYEDSVSVK